MAAKKTGKKSGNPFDFSDMFQDMMKMYEPERIAQMFDPQKFFEQMPGLPSSSMDMSGLMEKNQASFEAMVEANKAAAETYRDMLDKQMEIFNRMTTAAQDAAQGVQSPVNPDAAQKNAKLCADAAQKAFDLMREMAEAAQSANEQAFDRVSGQISAAMDDLKKG